MVSLPPEALGTHALVIGATGSGKTTLLHHLIAQDLVFGHSIVVLDARGDLVKAVIELAARLKLRQESLKLFDLREKTRPLGFSPLAGAGEPYYRALSLLDAVAAEWESLGPQTADAMRNAIMLLAEAKAPITQLEPLFYDPRVRRDLIARGTSSRVHDFWLRYSELSADRQSALASPVLNKVSLLFATEGLRRMFGHPTPVDLASHLDRSGSITLISLAVDELHGAGWMTGSLFLSAITREIFARVEVAESKRNPVRIYVDEFEHFGMREFENLLAEGRRFKCSLVLSHQTLAQLTPKLRSMILGNVGVKVVFRTARQDADTLNKDLIGTTKGFDLPSLAVGEAVLWRRGFSPIEVEVNAPLIEDVSGQSTEARSLLSAMRKSVPKFPDELLEPVLDDTEPDRSGPSGDPGPDLEDWL
jgi:DNA helicase HerA-like ATPase